MNQMSAAVFSMYGVRYQVTDVARAAAFYREHLGFQLVVQHPRRLPVCRLDLLCSCSVGLEPRDPGRCPVANRSTRAAGIDWFSA
jgi:catechol 2,3-dioxygenase-like lactoylglutathione lyase family enzyme